MTFIGSAMHNSYSLNPSQSAEGVTGNRHWDNEDVTDLISDMGTANSCFLLRQELR